MNKTDIGAEIIKTAGGYTAYVTGHADTGSPGGKEKCAAVSATVCAVFETLKKAADGGLIFLRVLSLSPGYAFADFTVTGGEKARERADTAMDILAAGLVGAGVALRGVSLENDTEKEE